MQKNQTAAALSSSTASVPQPQTLPAAAYYYYQQQLTAPSQQHNYLTITIRVNGASPPSDTTPTFFYSYSCFVCGCALFFVVEWIYYSKTTEMILNLLTLR